MGRGAERRGMAGGSVGSEGRYLRSALEMLGGLVAWNGSIILVDSRNDRDRDHGLVAVWL